MKLQWLLAAAVAAWVGASAPAFALDCSGAGISGLIVGQNSGGTSCNYLVVNNDGSVNTISSGGGGGAVNITQINGTTALAGAGATGAGSLRTTVAQDTTTIAGAAPGTAGTPSTNVISIQGVAGGTAQPVSQSGTWNLTNISGTVSLPTGAATAANQPTAATAGSTSSGQSGNVDYCFVTTAAPSYTTAQSDPCSLDTSGNMRVLAAQSGTWAENQTQINGSAIVTSATGVQKVGVVGNAGATLDAALTAATAPTNGFGILGEFLTALPSLSTGQTASLQVESDGSLRSQQVIALITASDGFSNGDAGCPSSPTNHGSSSAACYTIFPDGFNGSTWDRQRTAGIGNNTAATGIMAEAPYGQFTTNANIPAISTGNYGAAQVDPAGNLRTAPQRPTTADILDGYQTFTTTTGATTVITVTAGRTWVGVISAHVSCSEAAAGTVACDARAVFTTAGTSVTPAAGTVFACEAQNGANAASGLVGDGTSNFCSTPFTIVAPVGNTVTIQVASTNAGTASRVDAQAIGAMQ